MKTVLKKKRIALQMKQQIATVFATRNTSKNQRSSAGLGAILEQLTVNERKPIVFISRFLYSSEKKRQH